MSGGFWAGAVPPWAYVVGVCLCVLFLLAGMWAGFGRGQAEAEEERRWAREQAKARRTHPVYRMAASPREERRGTAASNDSRIPELVHEEAWPGWFDQEEQAIVLNPTAVLTPEEASWTGEIQRMTAAFERDMERLLGGTDDQLREITR